MAKKRQEFKKLVESGKAARDILSERGIIKKDDQSLIAGILQDPNAPILPGGANSPTSAQPYLPRPWTINAARRVMMDMARMWKHDIDETDPKRMNGLEFFKFVLEQLSIPESKLNVAIAKTVEDKEYDQKFLSQRDTVDALKKLYIDSFAISVISGTSNDVADFLEWFIEWTDRLLNLWPENDRWIDSGKTPKMKKQSAQ